MKILIAIPVLTAVLGTCFFASSYEPNHESAMQEKNTKDQRLFHIDELDKIRAKKKTRYHSFLNNSTMHCGVYHLKAGSKDTQSPHLEDEVYYVQSGKAKLKINDKSYDCKPGAILFVAAKEKHFFHDIEEDLTLLVFFSKAKPGKNP